VQRLQIALKQGGRRAPPYTLASIAAVCAQFTQFRTVPRAMKVIPISNELRPAGPAPVAPLRLPPGEVLRDSYGRELRDLRISVTDRCNFRCVYCMPREVFDKNYAFLPRSALMSFEEITRLVRIFAARGIHKIRLTGGEPLLRKGVEELVAMLAEIPGIELTLTTNGVLLPKLARPLREAGLHRLTVSLDSLDDAIFRRMNDADYPVANVLAGIDAAGAAGFGPVKINMVVKRGMNDAGIVDMARHFRGSGHIPRFIEFMDVGSSNGWELGEVVPSREVVERISAVFPLEPVEPNYTGEVAERWRYVDCACPPRASSSPACSPRPATTCASCCAAAPTIPSWTPSSPACGSSAATATPSCAPPRPAACARRSRCPTSAVETRRAKSISFGPPVSALSLRERARVREPALTVHLLFRHLPRQLLQSRSLDLLEVSGDLAAGGMHLLHVAIGLVDMGRQPLHALVEAREILGELAQGVLDDVDLLAGLDVLQHRPGGVEHRHQGRRRDDPYPPLLGVW
jgi:cyclic pyranopterin phosphate synthase